LKASRNEHGLLQAVICFENNNVKGQTSDGGSNENIHKGTVQVAAQYKLLKGNTTISLLVISMFPTKSKHKVFNNT
jgi:hypothetical protein